MPKSLPGSNHPVTGTAERGIVLERGDEHGAEQCCPAGRDTRAPLPIPPEVEDAGRVDECASVGAWIFFTLLHRVSAAGPEMLLELPGERLPCL